MLKSILQYFLRGLAKKIIKKYRPDVVGITGSVGKTSVKEAVTAVLSSKFNVRSNHKNYNNEIGLPLTIIGFEQSPGRSVLGWLLVFGRALHLLLVKNKNYPEILALEMGADKPGDIHYLVDIAPCKVGVLTFISHAHTEFFKTIKKIAQEKRVIISHLSHDDFAVLNFDNELVMQNATATKAEIVTYGFKEGADLRASDVNIINDEATGWPSGLNFKVNFKGNTVPVFFSGVAAEHLVPSFLAGLAVGSIFGVNLVEGAAALRQLKPLAGHMRLIPGIKGTLIIDDTYNSSPEPTKSALQTLAQIQIKPSAERYAVLGDMLELGTETENTHREVGFKAAELGINFLITVGEASKHTAAAAREAGLGEHQVASFADSVSAGKFLQEKLEPGDVVLIKGSQSTRMEKIVKEIMAEPLKAQELLVRQGAEWA
ncbi:MAG: UDP-N-acetylmuramoyl-tripeptide--D-alanyl-D-alanine ligase, partial [Patescibacteria group bacterium]